MAESLFIRADEVIRLLGGQIANLYAGSDEASLGGIVFQRIVMISGFDRTGKFVQLYRKIHLLFLRFLIL